MVTWTEPLLTPQLGTDVIVAVIGAAWVIITDVESAQPRLSVTVTLYVPAAKFEAIVFVPAPPVHK